MREANDALRFALEVSALAALAYRGWQTGDGAGRWLLAIASPLVLVAVWGRWMAPRSHARVDDPLRLLIEVAVFAAAAGALAAAGATTSALVLAPAAAVHVALTFALGQR